MDIDSFNIPKKKTDEDAREYAYFVLRKLIVEFSIVPGDKLIEVSLASLLKVSRTPIRDTIQKLSREHLVTVLPNKGAFVSKITPSSVQNSIWLCKKLGYQMIDSLYKQENRSSLGHLSILNDRLEFYASAKKTRDFIAVLLTYYRALFLLAGNKDFIYTALEKVSLDFHRFLYFSALQEHISISDIGKVCRDITLKIQNRQIDAAEQFFLSHMEYIDGALKEAESAAYDCLLMSPNEGN